MNIVKTNNVKQLLELSYNIIEENWQYASDGILQKNILNRLDLISELMSYEVPHSAKQCLWYMERYHTELSDYRLRVTNQPLGVITKIRLSIKG